MQKNGNAVTFLFSTSLDSLHFLKVVLNFGKMQPWLVAIFKSILFILLQV